MTTAGSAGTASDGFRVPETAGRHRAPPPPPRPKAPAVIAAAAGILGTSAIVAILGTTVAPTAQASPRSTPPMAWVAEPTLPRTYGPLRMPVIGAIDPEPAQSPVTVPDPPIQTRTPDTAPQAADDAPVATAMPSTATGNVATTTTAPTQTTTPTNTETTTAATTTSPQVTQSEETQVDETTSPTTEPTQTAETTAAVAVEVEIADQTTGGEE